MQNISDYKMVSLIPARGGSNRIPRKNIKMMAGKPMLAWSIEASLNSKYIDRTFVSTEDPEVKAIALQYGAEVVDRPAKYATDSLPLSNRDYEGTGLLWHFREALWGLGYTPDYLSFMYPTSPLRTSQQIDEAFELMIERNCKRVMSAYQMPPEPDIYYIMDKRSRAELIFGYPPPKEFYLKTFKVELQEPRYLGTADILIMEWININANTSLNYGDFTLYIMDKADVVDVDTPRDFAMAEYLLKERLGKEGGE